MTQERFDIIIIGGGFYGCCLALYFKSVASRVLILEQENGLLERASQVNQARIHTGFHYPRSFPTAMRSRLLQERFVADFEHAVVADFEMLYAIASQQSKVSAARFARMFEIIGATLRPAPARLKALFDSRLVEEVFACREYAFNWIALRDDLVARLHANKVDVRLNERVSTVQSDSDGISVCTNTGLYKAPYVFNATYANINALAMRSGLEMISVKHELAEVALVRPPQELNGLAVTLMDGPFFSTMPYPAAHLYSLTHVRYTPHYSWVDNMSKSPDDVLQQLPHDTRVQYMIQDASRFLPCMKHAVHERSLFDVKTVLQKNERNDGRPIMLHQHAGEHRIISIMGAKIDNIYDLFEALPKINCEWTSAHIRLLTERQR